MRTVRNILTVVAISAFLFACEAEDYANDDDNNIEIKAETTESDGDGIEDERGDE